MLDEVTKRSISTADAKAFMARPWSELVELERRHWKDALAADPLATFRASEALWELLRDEGHTTNAVERDADLQAHVRLRALLDRAAHVRAR
jgi:hypothetical protein